MTFAAQVRLGEWNVKQQSEKLPHEDFDIESKSVHPDYNPATFQNDIAVIKLKKKVIYKEHIIPVSPSTEFCATSSLPAVLYWPAPHLGAEHASRYCSYAVSCFRGTFPRV